MSNVTTDSLKRAIASGELWPALQPLIHLRTRKIAGFEMLARWTSVAHGDVPPTVFIPMAEMAGCLNKILLNNLSQVAPEMVNWPEQVYLAINLSPEQLYDEPLLGEIRAALGLHGVPLHRLRLEVTESSLIDQYESTTSIIDVFKKEGGSISLDDFGTGYSSLTRLRAFPFDEIKIDRSFVQAMDSDSENFRIVLAVIGLGQSLGMHVLAEGIESENHADLLQRIGCEFGQGFLFGRPADIGSINRYITANGWWGGDNTGFDTSPFQRWHQLEALYRGASVGLCFLDDQLRFVSVNTMFADLAGLSRHDLFGKSARDILGMSKYNDLLAQIEDVASGKTPPAIEYFDEDSGRTSLVDFQLVRSDLGEMLGVSGEAFDITPKVIAERALRESEEHFRRVIQLSPNIPWAANQDGIVDYIGPTFEWEPDTTSQQRHQRWLDRMPEDDRLRVRQEWLANLPTERPFKTEFRILWPDNKWRWVRSQAFPHFGKEGKIKRWFGLIVDISAERNMEEKIAELEARIRLLERHGQP